MKAPKKPKLISVPKAPKANASTQAWENYNKKLKEVESENNKRIAEYRKKEKAYNAEKNNREKVKDKARKLRSQLSGF